MTLTLTDARRWLDSHTDRTAITPPETIVLRDGATSCCGAYPTEHWAGRGEEYCSLCWEPITDTIDVSRTEWNRTHPRS